MQIEPFQQLKIGKGKIVNAIEPLRTWLTRKARVGRHQDVRLVQPESEARHGLRASATMQDEHRTTAVLSLVKAQGQAIGAGLSSSGKRRWRESAHEKILSFLRLVT